MGFYRNWNFNIKSKAGVNIKESIEALEARLAELDSYSWDGVEFVRNFADCSKYYAYLETYSFDAVQCFHDDLKQVSAEFPDLVFDVYMDSEDETHMRAIYDSGEHEEVYAQLVYPEFKRLKY